MTKRILVVINSAARLISALTAQADIVMSDTLVTDGGELELIPYSYRQCAEIESLPFDYYTIADISRSDAPFNSRYVFKRYISPVRWRDLNRIRNNP